MNKSIDAKRIQQGLSRIPGIKNTIAIASGKGGVGKSTTAVNLALALQAQGFSVGLLDADIYGPNQSTMLGVSTQASQTEDNKLVPIVSHGIASMSMAYLLGPDTPMIWRGPMIGKALAQLMSETAWPALDFLIIDLPPGTGDVQLTLAQRLPLTASVIVTTPQNVATQDAKKAVKMFEKLNIPVIGIIENMQHYHCPQCGHTAKIFGEGGAHDMSATMNIPYLGGIPLHADIRDLADKGIPIVAFAKDSNEAQAFMQIAKQFLVNFATLSKDYATQFGTIKVE